MTRRTRTSREAENRLDALEEVNEAASSEESTLDEDEQAAILDALRDLHDYYHDSGSEATPTRSGDFDREAVRATLEPRHENDDAQQRDDRQ